MELISLSCVFTTVDIQSTANYYEQKLGFKQVKYLNCSEPHICLYRDNVEIILTISDKMIIPNHLMYGYGYDVYFYTDKQKELADEFLNNGVKFVKELSNTDYNNKEFVIEDLDGRWLGFGLKLQT